MDAPALLTLCCLLPVILVRNGIVLRICMRRIEEIHRLNHERIDAGTWSESDLLRYQQLPNQYAMVLDLRKWTYRQFFPEASQ